MPPEYTRLIVDLDGTLYLGFAPLPKAAEAMARLRRTREILFLSNNCNQSAERLARRLDRMGLEAEPREVVSSVTLMVEAVNEFGSGLRVHTLSSGDLDSALEEAGHRVTLGDRADVVVVGVDVDLRYDSLARALRALSCGAVLIGANADAAYPTEAGLLPGAGAFVGAVRGMGFDPDRMCGKPDTWAMRKALSLRGFAAGPDCLLIGDRLDSDILGAQRLGIDSALVLTGASTQEDIGRLGIHPTYVADDFATIVDDLSR